MRSALLFAAVCAARVALGGTFDWGTLPGELERTPIDGQTTSDGKRVFMELRRARAKPEEVLSHCLERFAKAGFHIPRLSRQIQGPGPSLTALDVDTHVTYSVAVIDKGSGVVEVILGGADHSKRVDEGEWPLAHPAAKAPLRGNTEGARSVTFRASVTAKELEGWYDAELRARGFERRSSAAWERGAERVLLHVEAAGAESVATVWAEGPHLLQPPKDGGRR